MIHVFVGYDIREHAAWLVCKDTLLNPLENAGGYFNGQHQDVEVHPISHRDLRRRGLFDRPWAVDEKGQMTDVRDGRPFSTEFSHSRFLAPVLAKEMGIKSGAVVFVDCDFMFMRPISEMLQGIDHTKVVSVVKHDFNAVAEGVKMDGQLQQRYYRKLWSSLMVFNMGHEDIDLFDHQHFANTCSGSTLHGFRPFEDSEIGSIPDIWNHIPGHSASVDDPCAVHFSLGGPWMPGFEKVPYASLWRQRFREVLLTAHDKNLSALFPLV